MKKYMAADPKGNQQGGGQPIQVLDDVQMPLRTGNAGAKGSKYADEDEVATISNLKVGQGFYARPKDGIEPEKHRRMIGVVLNNYWGAKGRDGKPGQLLAEGEQPKKFETAVVDGKVLIRRAG